MKIKNKSIDREIYALSEDVVKKYRFLTAAFVLSLVGLLCYFLMGMAGEGALGEFFLFMVMMGVVALGIFVCYYLFGDCCYPFYKPTGQPLERTETFFDESQKAKLENCLEKSDWEAIAQLDKTNYSSLMLVRYATEDEHVFAMQLFESKGGDWRPSGSTYRNF